MASVFKMKGWHERLVVAVFCRSGHGCLGPEAEVQFSPKQTLNFASRIEELLPHHWISADYPLTSLVGQVQAEHPGKGEGDEHQAQ